MKKEPLLTGLIAAPFTPMNADGSLDAAAIAPYARHLVRSGGVTGVFVCGTTGEAPSLTTQERKIVVEKWAEALRGELKLVVHVGGTCQPQCAELAAHAQETGADAIAAFAPGFFKPATVADMVGFFAPVAGAAPDLPFYYYNMPSMTGVCLPVDRFLLEAKKVIPNLRGVKYTHNDLMEMQKCIRLGDGEFEVLHGFDEILITGLAVGARAAVGSTYNYIPSIYNAILEAMERGDLASARDMQWESARILDIVIRHGGGVRGGKMAMALAGLDMGPCRLPISPWSEAELSEMRDELKKTTFFQRVDKLLM